jgi:hypothetical protein
MANFVNTSTIGVQLGNSDGATAQFGLGQHVLGNQGSEWLYVNAIQAFTTGQLLAVNVSYSANLATATLVSGSSAATPPQTLAFAQGAFAANDYGWVALRGDNLNVNLSSSSTMGLPLYLSVVQSGTVTTVTGSLTLAGIIYQSVSATAIANPAITAFVTWPRVVQLGSGTLG